MKIKILKMKKMMMLILFDNKLIFKLINILLMVIRVKIYKLFIIVSLFKNGIFNLKFNF